MHHRSVGLRRDGCCLRRCGQALPRLFIFKAFRVLHETPAVSDLLLLRLLYFDVVCNLGDLLQVSFLEVGAAVVTLRNTERLVLPPHFTKVIQRIIKVLLFERIEYFLLLSMPLPVLPPVRLPPLLLVLPVLFGLLLGGLLLGGLLLGGLLL